jgi:hypothetical protein
MMNYIMYGTPMSIYFLQLGYAESNTLHSLTQFSHFNTLRRLSRSHLKELGNKGNNSNLCYIYDRYRFLKKQGKTSSTNGASENGYPTVNKDVSSDHVTSYLTT